MLDAVIAPYKIGLDMATNPGKFKEQQQNQESDSIGAEFAKATLSVAGTPEIVAQRALAAMDLLHSDILDSLA